MRLLLAFRNIRLYISTRVNTMQCLMSLHQTLQGNKRKTKSPARHREAHRSRQVRLGCEVMEDRVLMSPGLPDYHFTAPALVAGTTQHNAPSSIGAFTKAPGGTTQRIHFTAPALVAGTTQHKGHSSIGALTQTPGGTTQRIVSKGSMNAAGTTIDNPVAVDTNGNYYNYKVVNGTLFGPNGPVFTDVHQGDLGDCWLMSALAEAAARAPQDITRMFTDLGVFMENGVQVHVWSVHFYDATGNVKSVLVDNELPVDANNQTIYDNVSGGVLWAALAEKAYVEAAALGYVTVGNTTFNNYQSIDGGDGAWALQAITGQQPSYINTMYVNPGDLNTVFDAGDLVIIRTADNPASSLVPGDHYNAVIADYLPGNWPYAIYNPWGASDTQYYGSIFYANADFLQQNYNVLEWVQT